MSTIQKPDLYARITNTIIADLERGAPTWTKPWSANHLAGRITRPLRHNLQPYNGVNVLLLWAEATVRGFSAPVWMTFRQALALGAHVRKGESGSTVLYADHMVRTITSEDGLGVDREIPFLKAYAVFNVEQIEGLPPQFNTPVAEPSEPEQRIKRADRFFANLRADIRQGGSQAYYALNGDYVQLPPFESFINAERYYATLGHECCHWTRHPARLDRGFGRKQWGDEGYAREELVAELGSAFLCADLELSPSPREDHAAYIQSWLEVLRSDKRFIFSAAAHAQRALDYLHNLQPPD